MESSHEWATSAGSAGIDGFWGRALQNGPHPHLLGFSSLGMVTNVCPSSGAQGLSLLGLLNISEEFCVVKRQFLCPIL
jgi:hypothetical protein